MAKFCVFCGQKPESKNKEHVIPQWLIRMTGDPNREINLGYDSRHFKATGENKLRTFNFKSFQFPACEECNTKYGDLEGKVSVYFKRLFDKDYFCNYEIDQLLDWFDKVRVGLWLGNIMLDDLESHVSPKFHIEKRIGHRDRALFTYELKDDKWRGIQFIGFNTAGFQFIPSCFTLRVNNVYFFNYSFDFLFSKRIGFPYPTTFAHTETPERYMVAEFAPGSNKIKMPLIEQIFQKATNYIYQPILAREILNSELRDDTYNNQYVKENCLDFDNGRGSIFYYENGIHMLDNETELQLFTDTQNLNPESFRHKIAIQTLETLESLLKIKQQTKYVNEEIQKNIEESRKLILKTHSEQLKSYRRNTAPNKMFL